MMKTVSKLKQKGNAMLAGLIALVAVVVIGMAVIPYFLGQKVEVLPTEIARTMTKNGYKEDILFASKFRLDKCWFYCDRLVKVDVSDKTKREQLEIFMPKDKLILKVSVQMNMSVNPAKTDGLFKNLKTTEINDYTSIIEWDEIYKTYAQQRVVSEVRQYLSTLSIAEVASSLEGVNRELMHRVSKSVGDNSPFVITNLGIVDAVYPPIIVKAQENAAERREQIDQERAQLEVRTVSLERQLREAELQRKIEREQAEAEAEVQRTLANAVDPRVLELKRLEIEAKRVEKWNGAYPTTIAGGETGTMFLKQMQ